MTGIVGDVAYWDRLDSVCTKSKPPSPRRSMTATALGDGATVVLYGGQDEDAGGVLDNSIIGFTTPLKARTSNDSFLLQVIPEEAREKSKLGKYSCSRESSLEVESLRVLPSNSADGVTGFD